MTYRNSPLSTSYHIYRNSPHQYKNEYGYRLNSLPHNIISCLAPIPGISLVGTGWGLIGSSLILVVARLRLLLLSSSLTFLLASPSYFTADLADLNSGLACPPLLLISKKLFYTYGYNYRSSPTTQTVSFETGPLPKHVSKLILLSYPDPTSVIDYLTSFLSRMPLLILLSYIPQLPSLLLTYFILGFTGWSNILT